MDFLFYICSVIKTKTNNIMKIILNEVSKPMFTSFTMFAKPNLELLRGTETVEVSFHFHGKTRVSTSMQFGEYCVKINHKVESFKQFEKTEWNYFSGKQVTSNYFVVSKKQDFEAYKEYVKELISISFKLLDVELDEVTINLQGKF